MNNLTRSVAWYIGFWLAAHWHTAPGPLRPTMSAVGRRLLGFAVRS